MSERDWEAEAKKRRHPCPRCGRAVLRNVTGRLRSHCVSEGGAWCFGSGDYPEAAPAVPVGAEDDPRLSETYLGGAIAVGRARWAAEGMTPAVPVVHPEPGEHRTARWLAAYAPGDRLHPAVIARRLMALADVEVAAAVAAVRADTAREVADLAVYLVNLPGRHGVVSREDALAIIRGLP